MRVRNSRRYHAFAIMHFDQLLSLAIQEAEGVWPQEPGAKKAV